MPMLKRNYIYNIEKYESDHFGMSTKKKGIITYIMRYLSLYTIFFYFHVTSPDIAPQIATMLRLLKEEI